MCNISVASHHYALDREVEIAESMDDLLTSRSITGRQDFTGYDMLDAMIASVLKELLTHVHFVKRVSVKRAACSERRAISTNKAICLHDL